MLKLKVGLVLISNADPQVQGKKNSITLEHKAIDVRLVLSLQWEALPIIKPHICVTKHIRKFTKIEGHINKNNITKQL